MDHSQAATASAAGGTNSIMISQSTDTSPIDSSATSAATPVDDPKQNLTQVINSIQKTLGILHQLNLTVSSYNVASQLPLLQRMNNLVLELDNMTRLAEKCTIQVPMEVLNLIDDGKNPDEFTRDMLNGYIAKNQITKGKTDTFKMFVQDFKSYEGDRLCCDIALCLEEIACSEDGCIQDSRESLRKHLLEELDQAFPDEVEAYREIRAASAAENKRVAQSQNVLPNGDV